MRIDYATHCSTFSLCMLAAAAACSTAAQAQGGFAALVSPPRFEVHAKPGTTLRNVIEVSNRPTGPVIPPAYRGLHPGAGFRGRIS